MVAERPKSSAFTIKRRGFSARSIIGNHGSGKQPVPRAANEQKFLSLAQASGMRTKDIETLEFQFAQQTPVNRTHQLGGGHRPAVLSRQRCLGQLIKTARLAGDTRSQIFETLGVFKTQAFLL